jgi:hypothetical protein
MTDKMAIRTFPTAYKLKAIKRVERGDGVLPVDCNDNVQVKNDAA